jgi:hypothetical protein
MNQAATTEKMSGFDWFGLVSGIVGLVADALAIAAVFNPS